MLAAFCMTLLILHMRASATDESFSFTVFSLLFNRAYKALFVLGLAVEELFEAELVRIVDSGIEK